MIECLACGHAWERLTIYFRIERIEPRTQPTIRRALEAGRHAALARDLRNHGAERARRKPAQVSNEEPALDRIIELRRALRAEPLTEHDHEQSQGHMSHKTLHPTESL